MNEIQNIEPRMQVYAIERDKNDIKIGVTTNFECRKRALETQAGFNCLRYFTSDKLSNGYQVESCVKNKLKMYRGIGEWFSISFEEAIKTIIELEAEVGKKLSIAHSVGQIFPSLPTAMEELKEDDLILYQWFVNNGYELKYGFHVNPELSGMVVLGDFCGTGSEDIMDFELFASITKTTPIKLR